MKRILPVLIFTLILGFSKAQTANSIHTYTALAIDSTLVNLNTYYGKKLLIVNVASYCGYTPQYTDLQTLYQTYSSNNFEILGFPCNDFGAQEPGKDSTINSFCTTNYGVTFKMMHKISITAIDTSPVYKFLQLALLNGKGNYPVSWNFNKFLIDEAGKLYAWKDSPVNPLDTSITNWIMKPSVVTGIQPGQHAVEAELLSQNPVNDNLVLNIKGVQSQAFTIDLFTLEGKLVRRLSDKTLSSEKLSFPVSDLNSGMYFVKIQNNLGEKNIKIIVTR